MNCESCLKLIAAYHDDELTDVERIVELESHLAGCPACAAELQSLRALSGAVRQATYFTAPQSLHRAVRPRRVSPIWLLAAACLSVFAAAYFFVWRSADLAGSELVADHVRSLRSNHLFDVTSSSRHTVRPWFQGKLDFSPTVPDLSAQGFPLLGGRLDFVGERPAAALVYQHGRHFINVFVVRGILRVTPDQRDGFNLEEWASGGLSYAAISDMDRSELATFAIAFRSAPNP